MPSMCLRIVWINGQRTGKIGDRLGLPVVVAELAALEEEVVGRPTRRRPEPGARGSRRYHPALQRSDNRGDDFVLHGEYIRRIAVVSLRPDMATRACVDQLGSDSNGPADLADAAFDNMRHSKISTGVDRSTDR